MPHISSKKLSGKTVDDLGRLAFSVIQDTGAGQRQKILDELLTDTEKVMIAKRLGILLLLEKGKSLYEVSEVLNVSPSTAARFENAIAKNKYRHSGAWIRKHAGIAKFERLIGKLVALAFTGRTKSFAQSVRDM